MEFIKLTFNPFQENTYIIYDHTGECVIVDPGCFNEEEKIYLKQTIDSNDLKPVLLLNTHCHIDHVFGNGYVQKEWEIPLLIHNKEVPILESAPMSAMMFGVPFNETVKQDGYMEEGEQIVFGNTKLDILYTPGHSPGHVSFYSQPNETIFCGDVLFRESIGRTDLPGGDYDTLIQTIKEIIIPLGDNIRVLPGHGPETTIGYEKRNNPFLR